MGLVYAETERLVLRGYEEKDIPQLVTLLNDWDVAGQMANMPFPYTQQEAAQFFAQVTEDRRWNAPQHFAIEEKRGGMLIGAVALHPPRTENPQRDERAIGYWLGKAFHGKGYMHEAVQAVLCLAFTHPETHVVLALTNPENRASQNVLRKAGFTYTGLHPRPESEKGLRGSEEITRWQLTRGEYNVLASQAGKAHRL